MTGIKRLTPRQSRKVNTLVKKECCNCENGNCKWFRIAVLPLDKLLYAELYQTEDRKKCTVCGAFFASTSNSVKYCPDCRKRITRRQAAERMRKRRALVTR